MELERQTISGTALGPGSLLALDSLDLQSTKHDGPYPRIQDMYTDIHIYIYTHTYTYIRTKCDAYTHVLTYNRPLFWVPLEAQFPVTSGNILLTPAVAQLCDFGLVRCLRGSRTPAEGMGTEGHSKD